MRGSVITSVALHVVLLGVMLIGISPKPMDMAISEAMPVDLVPIEDVAQCFTPLHDGLCRCF